MYRCPVHGLPLWNGPGCHVSCRHPATTFVELKVLLHLSAAVDWFKQSIVILGPLYPIVVEV